MGLETITPADELKKLGDTLEEQEAAKEKAEKKEVPRMNEINALMAKHTKEGDIRSQDYIHIYTKIGELKGHEKKNAYKHVQDYLNAKKKHREDFTEKVDQMVLDGYISVDEAKKLTDEYKEKDGEGRTKMDEQELPKLLEKEKKKKQKYEDLIGKSPHFAPNGKLTPDAKKKLEAFKKLDESGKRKAKLDLLKEINTYDKSVELCKERYEKAKARFQEGDYETALDIMDRNLRLSERYPNSAQLQEYVTWAETDIKNLRWEAKQDKEITKLREDRDDSIRVADPEKAMEFSDKLQKGVNKVLTTTFSGSSESEKPRSAEWVTPYMQDNEREAKQTDKELTTVYDKLQLAEKEDEQQAEEADKALDETMAADAKTQMAIKGATDMMDEMKEGDQQEEVSEEKAAIGSEASAQARGEQKEEEQQLSAHEQHQLRDEREQEEVDGGQDQENVQVNQDEVSALSRDELKDSTVEMKTDDEGGKALDEQDMKRALDEGAKVKLVRKDREHNTREDVEKDLSDRLVDSQEDMLRQLLAEGTIKQEDFDRKMGELNNERNQQSTAKDIIEEGQRNKPLAESTNADQRKKNLFRVIGGRKHNPDAKQQQRDMQKNQDRKKEMMKNIAA